MVEGLEREGGSRGFDIERGRSPVSGPERRGQDHHDGCILGLDYPDAGPSRWAAAIATGLPDARGRRVSSQGGARRRRPKPPVCLAQTNTCQEPRRGRGGRGRDGEGAGGGCRFCPVGVGDGVDAWRGGVVWSRSGGGAAEGRGEWGGGGEGQRGGGGRGGEEGGGGGDREGVGQGGAGREEGREGGEGGAGGGRGRGGGGGGGGDKGRGSRPRGGGGGGARWWRDQDGLVLVLAGPWW